MASILTNASAMTALQTLRKVTSDLETTQDRISTGLKVAMASDNAAYWSIATTMKSDVAGFKAVSDALGLGSSTAISAANGADSVKDMLTEMKQRIVAAQSEGTDPKFIQDEVNQFIGQIEGIVNAASFNGDNWLEVSYSPDGSAKDLEVDVLSTLSRADGGVTPSYISFNRQDMRSDSVIGRATIEQEVDSTVSAKASMVFDVGTATGTYIDGQNLGLDNLSFKFTTEAMTINYTDSAGDVQTLVMDPVAVDIEVDLSDIVYDTDQATTEAAIVERINDTIAKQSYAAMLPAVFEQSKELAVAKEREISVKTAYDAAYAGYLAANANDFEGATSYAEATSLAVGAAFDSANSAFVYDIDADGTAETYDLSAATTGGVTSTTGTTTIKLGTIAQAEADIATIAEDFLGDNTAGAPVDYATAENELKDRILSVSFATIGGSRQLQFTVAGGYKADDTATDPLAATNTVADTNYTAKIEGVWMETKESDAFGGLAQLRQLDMENNAARSLQAIDDMLTKVIEKAAVLGSIENRIGIQTDFLSKLTDSMNKGIGLLVDADLTEESSRLQALQVQQQLATQALSIANQGPQNILSLFR
ncbi:flagellin N-terminal helical domain-containing protein [Azospirillum sp. ST 5-10]|uniref:flagellin N-terminal helical domain-containing protein n=1 Tax=unclassified Azospirillum TaxID=2630922 RepID=UPI003F4A0D4A